jgi:hypothetical protein
MGGKNKIRMSNQKVITVIQVKENLGKKQEKVEKWLNL